MEVPVGDFADLIVIGAASVFFLRILVVLRRRREGIIYFLKTLALAYGFFLLAFFIAITVWRQETPAFFAGLCAALVVILRTPRRSRGIPSQVRKRVIRRWERETGKTFDPAEWEVDHIEPFSKGGSHTDDNLRVVRKTENRSKGARTSWF